MAKKAFISSVVLLLLALLAFAITVSYVSGAWTEPRSLQATSSRT